MRTARLLTGGGGSFMAPPGQHLTPVDRMTDTYLWKHYLTATTVAGGSKFTDLRRIIKDTNVNFVSKYL